MSWFRNQLLYPLVSHPIEVHVLFPELLIILTWFPIAIEGRGLFSDTIILRINYKSSKVRGMCYSRLLSHGGMTNGKLFSLRYSFPL
jgi:hypothetical protein